MKPSKIHYYNFPPLSNQDRQRIAEISLYLNSFCYAGEYYESDRKGRVWRSVRLISDAFSRLVIASDRCVRALGGKR